MFSHSRLLDQLIKTDDEFTEGERARRKAKRARSCDVTARTQHEVARREDSKLL